MYERSADRVDTRVEKSTWVPRLEKAGELEVKLVPEPPVGHRAIFYVFGSAAVVVGVFLLIGGLVNSTHIIW